VHLEAGIALDLDLGPRTWDAGRLLAGLLDRRGTAPATTNIRFGFDPIGSAALGGGSPSPWSSLGPRFSSAISELRDRGFRGPFAAADGRVIHNAGGSEAQELAYVLAVAIAYLRALEAGATTLNAARDMIYFRLAADTDQLLTVAKLRALRKLWARIEKACGLTPAAACIAADTAWRMMTKRDTYVNMVRSTIAVAAAGIGGADAVTVLPFTIAQGLPDRFARRIARNTQLVLLEEANLARVADPAAGAGGIEELTSRLCHAAWTQFQEVEQVGGAWRALEQGLIQRRVAAVRAQREAAVARRKDSLTGTSNFPDLEEIAVTVLDVPRTSVEGHPTAVTFDALPGIRLAEPFERLRDASDLMLARSGARPKVFLANLGALSDFTARATFARNLFGAGGIEAIENDGFAGIDEMVSAFQRSGADLACLCGSDACYAKEAIAAAAALIAAGCRHLYLAGRPGAAEQALRDAGVGDFVYAGCDVLTTLDAAHRSLGIAR
jgi:methylmalonyl-CoA mutase